MNFQFFSAPPKTETISTKSPKSGPSHRIRAACKVVVTQIKPCITTKDIQDTAKSLNARNLKAVEWPVQYLGQESAILSFMSKRDALRGMRKLDKAVVKGGLF